MLQHILPGKSQHLLASWLLVRCLSVVAAKQQEAAAGRPNLHEGIVVHARTATQALQAAGMFRASTA